MRLLLNATSVTVNSQTGIERYASKLVKELLKLDANMHVVGSFALARVSSAHISLILALLVPILGRYEFLVRALWDQTFFRLMVMRQKPDVVFFPIQDGLLFPNVKQIVTIHDLHYLHFDSLTLECRKEIGTIRRGLYRWKMPHILRRSSAIVTVSESTRQDVARYFDIPLSKIHVIYNGYDESRFHIIDQPDDVISRYNLQKDNYVLFVGSILPHKNIDRLVQAFSFLKTEAKLVIVGVCKDSNYRLLVEKTAQSAGLNSDRLRFLEYVSDADLPYIYNGAKLLALPSLHEGFGVPIIEAMACGIPVVTSNCSAMPEVAGNAAILVDPYSVESITAAMNNILNNSELVNELRTAGLSRAGMFSWGTSAQQLYNLFQRVCEL